MRLGVIGYGERLRHMARVMKKQDGSVTLAAVADPRREMVLADELVQAEGAEQFDTPQAMLHSAQLDAVAIGTRCSLHAQLASEALATGLPLFLEKPVATSLADLRQLYQAGQGKEQRVVVSFPLRGSGIVRLAKEIIDSGKIGTVEHVQAVNNVPYGSVYYQNWYRDENETQGLFLQKATHDFDYINYLLGIRPVMVCAMHSKQIFKGGHPAGLHCADCEEQLTCSDSVVLKKVQGDPTYGDMCCFAVDTGNEDSGSAIVRYESGMHASYSQNFFARRGAAARGATLLGYKGTLQFDFYQGKITVHMHHTPRVETYELGQGDGHHGGDEALAQEFIRVVKTGAPSQFSLDAGLLSALMCLRARQSAQTNTFQAIAYSLEGMEE